MGKDGTTRLRRSTTAGTALLAASMCLAACAGSDHAPPTHPAVGAAGPFPAASRAAPPADIPEEAPAPEKAKPSTQRHASPGGRIPGSREIVPADLSAVPRKTAVEASAKEASTTLAKPEPEAASRTAPPGPVVLAPTAAKPRAIPDLDVDAFCARMSGEGPYANHRVNDCVRRQRVYYESVRTVWDSPELRDEDRAACVRHDTEVWNYGAVLACARQRVARNGYLAKAGELVTERFRRDGERPSEIAAKTQDGK